MSNDNDIYRSLGSLEANMNVVLDGLKQINDKLTIQNGSITKAHARLDDMQPHVDDLVATKNRAIMGLLGIGGATGLIGGKISAWLTGLMGG